MTTPFTGKQNTLFRPTQFSGCKIWLDGQDPSATGILPANGASIATWTDKSGNGNSASQGTVSKQPTYIANTGLQFSSANATCLLGSSYFTNTTTGVNCFLVGTPQNASGRQRFILLGTSNSYGALIDNQALAVIVPGTYNGDYGPSFSLNTRYIISCNIYTSGAIVVAINGTDFTPPSGAGGATNRYEIGGDAGNVVPLNGIVHEILYYDVAFTVQQKQQMEGYLAWKWGIQTSLPATHPYRFTPVYANQPFPLVPRVASATNVLQGNPRTIPGCQLWLDAADRNFINGTSYVTGMTNKANTAQLFSASGTGLAFSNINGVPSIYFPGTGSSYLSYASSTNLTSGTSFIMFSNVSTNAQYTPFYIWKGSPTYQTGLGWTSLTTIGPYVTNAGNQTPSLSVSTSTPYIVTHQWTSASTTNLALNGAPYTSGTIRALDAPTTPCLIQIGADYGTNLIANIGEIIIYNVILTDPQRQQVEGYLAWKWGLVGSLPDGHPYKRPPLAPFPYAVRIAAQNRWLPTQISGCQLWLDARDSSVITLSGTTLTGWTDKSGTGKTITVNSGPTYSSTGFNALPCFTFTTSNYLTTTISAIGTNDVMFVYVGKITNPSQNSVPLSAGAAASGSELGLGWNLVSNLYNFYQYGVAGEGNSANNIGGNVNLIQIGTRIASTMAVFINGALPSITGTNSLSNTQTTFYIGNTGSFSFAGQLCEVLLYVGTTTTAQRQQLEGYLAWKWRLVGSLPSNHPYKLFPPSP